MKVDRRKFLLAGLGGLAGLTFEPFTKRVLAIGGPKHQPNNHILVVVNLTGGIDGLSLVVNYGQSQYYTRRQGLAIPAPGQPGGAIDIEPAAQIGLTPFWPEIAAEYALGDVAILQKVGYPTPNLSHFDSQDIWSRWRRNLSHTDKRGGLGRLSDIYFTTILELVGINTGNRLDFASNYARRVVLGSLSEFQVPTDSAQSVDSGFRNTKTQEMISAGSPAGGTPAADLLVQIQSTSVSALNLVGQVQAAISTYPGTTTYPAGSFASSLRDVARLIYANVGTRVFYVQTGGFDTHGTQNQTLMNLNPPVSAALGAFIADVKAQGRWNDVVILVLSEFGRRNYIDGSGGTDHGHGNYSFVLGGPVLGGLKGNVVTNADILQNQLPGDIDFRQIYWDLVQHHLGYDPTPIFDDWMPGASLGFLP